MYIDLVGRDILITIRRNIIHIPIERASSNPIIPIAAEMSKKFFHLFSIVINHRYNI
jgi:hypothetical protein